MGLFNKESSKYRQQELAEGSVEPPPYEGEAVLDAGAGGDETPEAGPEQVDASAGGGQDPDVPESSDLLDELRDEGTREQQADVGLDAGDGPESEGEEAEGDDLMDIFSSEQEEDVDLSALTDNLDDLDVDSLLAEASDVSVKLREAADGGR